MAHFVLISDFDGTITQNDFSDANTSHGGNVFGHRRIDGRFCPALLVFFCWHVALARSGRKFCEIVGMVGDAGNGNPDSLIVAVTAAACYLPPRRATRVA